MDVDYKSHYAYFASIKKFKQKEDGGGEVFPSG
jgi:hypothetical protein